MLNSCSIYLSFLLPVILFSVEIISFSFFGYNVIKGGPFIPIARCGSSFLNKVVNNANDSHDETHHIVKYN